MTSRLYPIWSFEGVRIVETFFHAGFKCEVVRTAEVLDSYSDHYNL